MKQRLLFVVAFAFAGAAFGSLPVSRAALAHGGRLVRRPAQMVLNNENGKLDGWKIARIVHVASGAEIPFGRTPGGWLLQLPGGFAADPYADTFELFFAGE